MSFFIWVWASNSFCSRSLCSAVTVLLRETSPFRALISRCRKAKMRNTVVYCGGLLSNLNKWKSSPPLPDVLCSHWSSPDLPSAPLSSVSTSWPVLSSPPAPWRPPSGSPHAKQRPRDPPSFLGRRWTLPAPCKPPLPAHIYECGVVCFPCWWTHNAPAGLVSAAPGAPRGPPAPGCPSLWTSAPALPSQPSSEHLTE